MHPRIERARFGSIQVNGKKYTHDIIIVPGVGVRRRAKELSKDLYGTSHKFSLAEAEHVYAVGITRLIIGTGMFGRVRLMPDAQEFFDLRGVRVDCLRTGQAAAAWNSAEGALLAVFHVTC